MAELVSQREYARRRGVTHRSVQKAIKDGRIAAAFVDGKIDVDKANKLWKDNTDETKSSNSVSGDPKHRREPDEPPQPAEPAESAGEQKPSSTNDTQSGPSYTRARSVRETFLAKTAEVDYKERIGKLHNTDECKVARFNEARRARDMLLTIPARISPILAGITDIKEIDRILTEELRIVCTQLAKDG
jgi:hypothetical protein